MPFSMPNRRRVRTAGLISVLALAASPLALSGPAWAAEIPDAVTSVDTQGSLRVGDSLTLVAQWSVPDYSQPGDTFTLALPTELSPMQTEFNVLSDTGEVVATAQVQDGNVVVTLTDYVAENPIDLQGQLRFNATVNESATPGEPIVIAWGEVTTTIVPGEPWGVGDITRPSKYGWVNESGGNSWSVQVPGPLTNVVVTDTPVGHQIDCGTLRGLVGVSVDGAYPTSWESRSIEVISCDASGWTVSAGDIEADQLVLLQGDVDMAAGVTPDPSDGLLYNGWSVTADQDNTDGTGVSVVYGADGTGGGTGAPEPSPEPTPEPTEEPTTEPTVDPTPEPTSEPTTEPTEEPTSEPSVDPVPEPTEEPSAEPTADPTTEPTTDPTSDPTTEPTSDPSEEPSAEPTADPTTEPSTAPSEQPGEQPTKQPADAPTDGASGGPTGDSAETPPSVSDESSAEAPAADDSPSAAAAAPSDKSILVRTGLAGENGGVGPTVWIIGAASVVALVSGAALIWRRRAA